MRVLTLDDIRSFFVSVAYVQSLAPKCSRTLERVQKSNWMKDNGHIFFYLSVKSHFVHEKCMSTNKQIKLHIRMLLDNVLFLRIYVTTILLF